MIAVILLIGGWALLAQLTGPLVATICAAPVANFFIAVALGRRMKHTRRTTTTKTPGGPHA
ncbi:hypothetical protein OG552_10185 [Streptomyces sp. NBC_01476]|uniref:hypothetical protein n=1 Tax=Streptomyces sp. NBC_01476 TaxID=2903881 RepID=UPI002E2F0C46|nr:hypothetical protein [Streptomyces sp. NBC_01476]